MGSSLHPASDLAPLTAESRALYEEFWAQVGVATTTQPPMDFRELKAGALTWGERLKLPAGIMGKFRQRLDAAQNDKSVFDLMKEFALLGNARAAVPPAPAAAPAPAPPAGPDRKTARTLTRDWRNEALLDDLRRVAQELGKNTLTVAEYKRLGKSTPAILIKRFQAWNNALALARLDSPNPLAAVNGEPGPRPR